MKTPKIWICCQTSANGNRDNIILHSQAFKYVDGIVYAVNYQTIKKDDDGIYFADQNGRSDNVGRLLESWLDKYFLEGEVFYSRFANLHYISPTLIMQSGHFKEGDWIFLLDSPEIPKEEFLKNLRENISNWDTKGVTAAGWNGKIFLFKWNSQIVFQGTPHQYPVGIKHGYYVELADESKVRYTEEGCHFGDFILNKRKLENSHIIHALKYTFCYNVSNQLSLFYKGEELVEHEKNRLTFINSFREETGKENTVENLKLYLSQDLSYIKDVVARYFDYEPIYRDYFRLEILKTPLGEILDTRSAWSFYDFWKKKNNL